MAKKKYRQQQTESRKFRRVSRRVQQQQRLLLYATLAFAALLLGILGYGVLDQKVLRFRRPVAKVNGEVISAQEFVVRARLRRAQLINQVDKTLQYAQFFGNDPQFQQYFQSQIAQAQRLLDNPQALGREVINALIEERLIVQEAQKRGITVSEEEIDRELEATFGYYPNGTPTPQPVPTLLPTSTLSPTQRALLPPTPTPTSTTLEPTATPTTGPTPTPTLEPPTPTPYTAEAYQQDLAAYIQRLQKEYGVSEDYLRQMVAATIYRRKLMEQVTQDLPRTREEVWARHILVKDKTTALDVLHKLAQGADWNELAAEYSQDPGTASKGGDLGWFARGEMVPEFEQVAFRLKIGEISEPVHTQYGWHIIQVLGHEERPISEGDYQRLKEEKFQEWLSTLRAQADIQLYDGWESLVPTEPALPPEIEQMLR